MRTCVDAGKLLRSCQKKAEVCECGFAEAVRSVSHEGRAPCCMDTWPILVTRTGLYNL